MTFRGRLTLFFVLIVVVPMVAVAVLVVAIAGASRDGKADARLAGGVRTGLATYRADLVAARRSATAIARDPSIQSAVTSGDATAVRSAAETAARERGLSTLAMRGSFGTVRVGAPAGAVAIATAKLASADGPASATISASTTTGQAFVAGASRLSGLDVAVLSGSRTVATTTPLGGVSLPARGESSDVTAAGQDLRATTAELPGTGGFDLALLGPIPSAGLLSSKPLVAAALVAFLALALALVALVMRTLSGQVSSMLAAARRIGDGDFGGEVPVVGDDEMAGLALEFNKMSDRLRAQMGQLRHQRDEIELSVRRIGEAFASGLDRKAMLGIVADTAISACNASYGVIALAGRIGDEAEAGEATAALRDAVVVAEERATRGGAIADHEAGGANALSAPIVRLGSEPIGVMSIARQDRPFDPSERDVFRYLLGQAATSIENIALHELVSEQAITDDLTGLSNKRRFREFVVKEAARAARFGHSLSLLILDLDDFKHVNDVHGHPKGDEVLRRVSRVLDTESRWVDEPSRYGGEEFAVALPETDLPGAVEVAERIRERIAGEEVPPGEGSAPIRVTASIGVATIPASAPDVEELVAAADAALYESKRAGKNRVSAAASAGDGSAATSPRGRRAARPR